MSDLQYPVVLYQYKNAFAITTLIQGIFDLSKTISTDNLYDFLDIDAASGLWLDQIGKYLGQQRPFMAVGTSFQWDITPWDDTTYTWDAEGSPVSDAIYKLILKALIKRRNSKFSINEIIDVITYVLKPYAVEIVENIKDLEITIYVENQQQKTIAGFLGIFDPKWFGVPTGVSVSSTSIVIVTP